MRRLKAPERRKQLMDVATRLFAERGYDATTTAGIAAAAGVSEPILYRHFRSKQELFISIITSVTQSTREKWHQLLSSVRDPSQAMAMISLHWPEHLRSCALEYAVIHTALVSSKDPEVLRVLRIHYEELEKGMMEIVSKGQELGVFINADLYSTARWVLHNGIGYTFQSLTLGVPEKYDLDTAVELTLRAVRKDGHLATGGSAHLHRRSSALSSDGTSSPTFSDHGGTKLRGGAAHMGGASQHDGSSHSDGTSNQDGSAH